MLILHRSPGSDRSRTLFIPDRNSSCVNHRRLEKPLTSKWFVEKMKTVFYYIPNCFNKKRGFPRTRTRSHDLGQSVPIKSLLVINFLSKFSMQHYCLCVQQHRLARRLPLFIPLTTLYIAIFRRFTCAVPL